MKRKESNSNVVINNQCLISLSVVSIRKFDSTLSLMTLEENTWFKRKSSNWSIKFYGMRFFLEIEFVVEFSYVLRWCRFIRWFTRVSLKTKRWLVHRKEEQFAFHMIRTRSVLLSIWFESFLKVRGRKKNKRTAIRTQTIMIKYVRSGVFGRLFTKFVSKFLLRLGRNYLFRFYLVHWSIRYRCRSFAYFEEFLLNEPSYFDGSFERNSKT